MTSFLLPGKLSPLNQADLQGLGYACFLHCVTMVAASIVPLWSSNEMTQVNAVEARGLVLDICIVFVFIITGSGLLNSR